MRLRLFTLLIFLGGCAGTTQGTGTTTPPEVVVPEANPEGVRLLVEGARLMRTNRRNAQAQAAERFEGALRIDPHLWEAHYNLAVLARRAGRLDDAIASLEAARAIDPASREIALALAECLSTAGRQSQAIDVMRDRVRRDETDADARIALATLLREAGRHDAALEAVRDVLVRDSSNVGALLEVARIYRAREDYEVAALVITKALTLVGAREGARRAPIFYERGLLELARGDTQAAFEAFGEANRADPRYRPARRNQAAVLMRAGDYAGAAAELDALLRIDPNDQDAHVAHAVALRGQGRNAQARAELEAVLRADEGHLAAIYNLAVLEADFLGRRGEAKTRFERFLTLAPRNHPQRAEATRYVREITAEQSPQPQRPEPQRPTAPTEEPPPVDDDGFEEL